MSSQPFSKISCPSTEFANEKSLLKVHSPRNYMSPEVHIRRPFPLSLCSKFFRSFNHCLQTSQIKFFEANSSSTFFHIKSNKSNQSYQQLYQTTLPNKPRQSSADKRRSSFSKQTNKTNKISHFQNSFTKINIMHPRAEEFLLEASPDALMVPWEDDLMAQFGVKTPSTIQHVSSSILFFIYAASLTKLRIPWYSSMTTECPTPAK